MHIVVHDQDALQPVVVDGTLVSARTWQDNAPFLREFMKLLRRGA